MKSPLSVLGLLLVLALPVPAQEGNASKVFAEVNRDLGGYKSLEHIYEPKDGDEFHVKAWMTDGTFRRIKASQKGDGGVLARDFYYDAQGGLKFALASLTEEAAQGKPPTVVEEKFDFEDGALVRYLGPNKQPVAKADKNFAEMEKALITMSDDLIERIEGSTAYAGVMGEVDAPKAPVGTIFGAGYSDGTFAGTEEGDLLHLDLKQADGGIETFIVLQRDSSVETLLKEGVKGARIRIHWTEKMQDIPQAGESARVKICDRIEKLE